MKRYTFEPYRPHLKGQVARLQRHLWGVTQRLRAEYLDWKYHRNPYITRPLLYVALHEGRVVGMRGMFGSCWECGDFSDSLILPVASDSVIEPAHRVGGLFVGLNEYAMADLSDRGYSHVLNLSATPENYLASVLMMKWRTVGSLKMMLYESASEANVASLAQRARRLGLGRQAEAFGRRVYAGLRPNIFSKLDRNWRLRLGRARPPIDLSEEVRPKAMADLVTSIGSDGRIRHVRDESYFAWRFKNPRSRYRFLYWGREDLGGYLVLGHTMGRLSVNIVDWEAPNAEVRQALLRTALDWGRFSNLGIWCATLPQKTVERLRELGFRATDKNPRYPRCSWRFLIRRVDADAADAGEYLLGHPAGEMGSWDLRMIYSDAV